MGKMKDLHTLSREQDLSDGFIHAALGRGGHLRLERADDGAALTLDAFATLDLLDFLLDHRRWLGLQAHQLTPGESSCMKWLEQQLLQEEGTVADGEGLRYLFNDGGAE